MADKNSLLDNKNLVSFVTTCGGHYCANLRPQGKRNGWGMTISGFGDNELSELREYGVVIIDLDSAPHTAQFLHLFDEYRIPPIFDNLQAFLVAVKALGYSVENG